jgi:hypothetical protein
MVARRTRVQRKPIGDATAFAQPTSSLGRDDRKKIHDAVQTSAFARVIRGAMRGHDESNIGSKNIFSIVPMFFLL